MGTGEGEEGGGRGWEKDLFEDIGTWHSPARQPSF